MAPVSVGRPYERLRTLSRKQTPVIRRLPPVSRRCLRIMSSLRCTGADADGLGQVSFSGARFSPPR